MAAKTDKTAKDDKAGEVRCCNPPAGKKPSVDQVTRICCALLQAPGYAMHIREEQHQDRLVTNAVNIATKIINALEA